MGVMKNAYTLLGVLFIIVIGGAILAFQWASPPSNQNTSMALKLTSSAFEEGGVIPQKYTCNGENINPPLSIEGAPDGTRTLALIVDDPDIPESIKQSRGIDSFDHWVVFNIPPAMTDIEERKNPLGVVGLNSAGKRGYTGPCPPDREHRYFFRLYALDTELSLSEDATKVDVLSAMEGHIIEETALMGKYDQPR